MSDMFSGCLKFNADLSKWNVERVEDMSYMFSGCVKFNADLSKWNVARVRRMTEMFAGCKSFTFDLSGWKIGAVKDPVGMFLGCPLPKEKWPKGAEVLGAGQTYEEFLKGPKWQSGAGGDDGATED